MSDTVVCSRCGQQQPGPVSTCLHCAAPLVYSGLPGPSTPAAMPPLSGSAGFYVPSLPGGRVSCPQCGHSNAPQRIHCKKCFTLLPKIELMIPPAVASRQKRDRTIATFAILGSLVGVALLALLQAAALLPASLIAAAWFASAVAWIVGWCYYARSKGYPALRGLLSLFGLIGALILIIMRDRSHSWR